MKTSGVSQISITTTWECEEPISALLERIFGSPPTIYASAETNLSTVTSYIRGTPSALRAHLQEIREGIGDLEKIGLDIGPAEVRTARVRREDWAESWKKYFKVISIGRALLIKPSWSKIKANSGQVVVVLDPGLSFGTGQHPTTSFCLRQIVAFRGRKRKTASFLDIGCGSGILAISAAKLGYSPADAFDFDPISVRVARRNCRVNRVEKKVGVTRKDLTKIPLKSSRTYDVICANLMAPLLIAERDRIINRLNTGGVLILAGILANEFNMVRTHYEAAGFRMHASKIEREWQSGAFKRVE